MGLPKAEALIGHAGVDTTAKYDRRGERVQRAAVQKLHVPYQRRFGVVHGWLAKIDMGYINNGNHFFD